MGDRDAPSGASSSPAARPRDDSGDDSGERERERPSGLARRLIRAIAKRVLVALVVAFTSALLLGLYALVIWLRLPTVDTTLATGDPGPSAFMSVDRCARPARVYVPLSRIDKRLACTVVWAEDWRFFDHDGVDWIAFESAMRDNWRRGQMRLGASTIPMQLARNLYLSRRRTPSRKLREMELARRLVARLGRARVLELYLNAAEWAPCVYGVEAAARYYFGHSAASMEPAEAVFLAAMLPRPKRPPGVDAEDRKRLIRRQQSLLTMMGRAGLIAPAMVRKGRAAVFRLLTQDELRNARENAHHESASEDSMPAAMADSFEIPKWFRQACGTRP